MAKALAPPSKNPIISKDASLKEVPPSITDRNGIKFVRGRFLGKGGFARCYELTNTATDVVVAGKVVSKTLLRKQYQKEKMIQEISIHRDLNHPHVVKLLDYFEDSDNVYVVLELCARRSLMELHKRRRGVTEPEARYFTGQVVDAVGYLHEKKVIHRDLKLGNLFINNEMQLKIGDFGLATTLDFDGERKKTLCGTPNYIAPEVLDKKGHSYEVDVWAVGCILYTLIAGKPPFQTKELKDTYERIKANQYKLPCWMSETAKVLITQLLAADPSKRPKINQVKSFEFFTKGYLPVRLPTSCLTMAPKFPPEQCPPIIRCSCCPHPSTVPIKMTPSTGSTAVPAATRKPVSASATATRALQPISENAVGNTRGKLERKPSPPSLTANDGYLSDLFSQLVSLLSSPSVERVINCEDVAEAPEAMPVFWVSKWVDYSDKYGIGYQLCDNSVGVLFNDASKMIMDSRGNQLFYIQRNNSELYYYGFECPAELEKKFTLLKYFRKYMNENLLKAGEHVAPKIGDELARLPHVRAFFRTSSAIVFHLSNGTLQINFFKDHTKLIVCPLMGAVTYLNSEKIFRVFKFSLIEKFGCSKDLLTLLRYAKTMVERLLSNSTSRMAASSDKLSRDGRVG